MNKINLKYLLLLAVILLITQKTYALTPSLNTKNTIEFTVYVYDAADTAALNAATVFLRREGITVGYQSTNGAGMAIFTNIKPGKYFLYISYLDYHNFSDTILIDKEHHIDSVGLHILENGTTTDTVNVTAERYVEIQPVKLNTGIQIFDVKTYHESPVSQMSTILTDNLIGAAKAPTGEVHIRGMHGEFTYYLDGIPVPLGVFGGLNEVVDPKVINKMNMLTGCFPAEFGGQMAGIMDIQTIMPSGHLHLDFSTYAGTYLVFNGTKPFSPGKDVPYGFSSNTPGDTLGGKVGPFRAINSNGQFLAISDKIKSFGYYISASRQETDRRVDTPVPNLFNDHGTDYFLFGKFDYLLTANDRLTANLNYGITHNQVPFDTTEQGFAPDNQISYNGFQTLSYFHLISSDENAGKDFFVGVYARQGGLNFMPSAVSPATFQFAGDSTKYALSENRSFNTIGLRTKLNYRISSLFKFDFGLNFSNTTGHEDFSSRDILGNPGPAPKTAYSGSDFGIFAQMEHQPLNWFRLDLGVRYDQHIAPDVDMQTMFSPRIKFNFFLDQENTIFLYYGKLFMPTNIEGLRILSGNVSNSGGATLPEKDDMAEVDYIHSFPFGLTLKTDIFYKYSSPGLDDQTIGSSAVKIPVNIASIHTTGIEMGLSYSNPEKNISAYLNGSIIHTFGVGAITGGFLQNLQTLGSAADLDHDQRLTLTTGINYQPQNYFINLDANYGSGLTNGNPNNIVYQSGLFDFNSAAHVSPYVIFNLSFGYIFHFDGETTIEPSIYVNNLFDNNYLLKGAYFSGASWGERRNVILKLSVHI